MERKLRYLEKGILKDKLQIIDTGESPDAPQPREMIDLEVCVCVWVYVWVSVRVCVCVVILVFLFLHV